MQSLLTPDELHRLHRSHRRGRLGYDLLPILGIILLKLHHQVRTVKGTLSLLRENGNLKDMLGITRVPSEASVSRLSREVERIVDPSLLHERVIQAYTSSMDRLAIGHLSIDSTTIGVREKPIKTRAKEAKANEKRGRKAKGSLEEQQYRERQARLEQERIAYLQESFGESLARLEMRCSITAKQNSKGKKQWFIGYKAHLATDDHGVPVSFAVTGASVHDSKVAVPLMKKARKTTDFLYVLLDKGVHQPCDQRLCRHDRKEGDHRPQGLQGGGRRSPGPRFPEAVCCQDHRGEDQRGAQGRVPSRHHLQAGFARPV